MFNDVMINFPQPKRQMRFKKYLGVNPFACLDKGWTTLNLIVMLVKWLERLAHDGVVLGSIPYITNQSGMKNIPSSPARNEA